MKLTTFLFLISLISAFAGKTYSQTKVINLKVSNSSVKEVLRNIEDQSEFYFMYSERLVDVTREVSINIKNAKVDEVLDKLFASTDVKYTVKDRFILLSTPEVSENDITMQQQKSVSGKITDSSGASLPGVSIVVKGTTTGTITDENGNYSLSNVPENAVLQFSFVGMKGQEVAVGNKSVINVSLEEEAIGVDEVVVVGYGIQKKSHLTAAIDQVGQEVLENRPVKSVTEALLGTVPGLNVSMVNGAPQQDFKLNIRGFTGFGSEGSPLVLVDGVERTLGDVNPNDVESITVIKDAAASAIYGSRAPFGVILVTTKSGDKNKGTSVTYSGDLAFGTPSGMPSMSNSWTFAERYNQFFRNGLQTPQFGDEAIQRMKDYAAGVIDYNNIDVNGGWGRHFISNDNVDYFDVTTLDVIPSQRHNLSFSGGSGKTSYYMGIGYNESVGIFAGTGDQKNRYTALLKVNSDIKDWLNLNFSMNYVNSKESGPAYSTSGRDYNTIFNWISRTWPNWGINQPNGSPNIIGIYDQLTGALGMVNVNGGDLNVSGGFTLKPLKGWDITGKYAVKLSNERSQRTAFAQTGYEPNGTLYYSLRAPRLSELERMMNDNKYTTTNIFTSYTKEIKKHYFYALAGYQREDNLYNQMNAKKQELYSNDIPSLNLATGIMDMRDVITDWATEGFFGRFSYNYAEKYLIEFNGRYDAHSKYPKDIRWAFFPSLSAAWNIAKESFWPTETISSFKVRGSITSSGDPGRGNYLYLAPMGTAVGGSDVILGGIKPSMVYTPALVSNNITWAKPRTIGVGLDVNALKNRLEVNYDWYQRTIYDQPGPVEALPETLGTNPPVTNNAVSETRGWEFSAKWKDGLKLGNDKFNYYAQFRISDYIGYVVEYQDNLTGVISGAWTPGEVFGRNYMYRSAGVAQTIEQVQANVTQGTDWYHPGDLMMQDLNGDGKIDSGEGGYWYSRGDQISNGFNYPRYRYGITLGADWKGIDFSILLDGVGSWKMYNPSPWLFPTYGGQWSGGWYQEHEDLGVWSPETPNAFYPRLDFYSKNTNRANDQYAINLANLKIKNIRLGYSLPNNLISKVNMQKVYFYSSIENLGYIFYKSWINYDPDIIDGYNGQGYPLQRVISFGVNLTL